MRPSFETPAARAPQDEVDGFGGLMVRNRAKPRGSDHGHGARGALRLAAAMLIAGLAGGCFQPLYGEHSLANSPTVAAAMAGVDVAQIDAPPGTPLARLAVEVRNELTFGLNGGGASTAPTHRLAINLRTSGSSLIVDPTTARPEFEIISLDADYKLFDVAAKKQVIDGAATARVSYDIPGQQQRLGALRGQRDAQSRAAKVIADQIRTRLAAYFAAGS